MKNTYGKDAKYEKTIVEVAIILAAIRRKYERRGVRFDGKKRIKCKYCSGFGYILN